MPPQKPVDRRSESIVLDESFPTDAVANESHQDHHEQGPEWPPPENVAAVVNGLAVVLVPAVVLFFAVRSSMNAPVRPAEYSGLFMDVTRMLESVVPLAAVGLIAGWRTLIHSRAYLNGTGNGWMGVLEGGALGSIPGLVIAIRSSRYAIAYAVVGLILGLTIGLILRCTALLTLKILARR
jgi:hypothetical protein